MTNYPFTSIDDFEDIESVNYFNESVALGQDPAHVLASLRVMSRDNSRTPMQWDDSVNAGFTEGTPWLAVNPNHLELNAAKQLGDPDSVFEHYRSLIRLRHEEPTVAVGDFTMLLRDDPQLFAFTRRHGTTELLVVANLSGEEAELPSTVAGTWEGSELLSSNVDAAPGARLEPWEARVHRRTLAQQPG